MHKKPRNTRDQTKSDLNKVSLHTFKKRILFNTSTKIVVFQAHFGKWKLRISVERRNSRLFNKSWKVKISREGSNHTSLKSPFNSCRTLYFFQLLHWKALCFQTRWGKRRYIIFDLSSKRLTVALNLFKQLTVTFEFLGIVTNLVYFSGRCYNFSVHCYDFSDLWYDFSD